MELEAALRRAGSGEELSQLEGDTWRLAVDVQEYARRHHLTLAWPIFARSNDHAQSRSVFLCGGEGLRGVAQRLGDMGFKVFARVDHGERAQGRWKQLRAATLAVVDLGSGDSGEYTSASYEAGLALALGKPMVVTTRPGVPLPFDISLEPVELSGNTESDANQILAAMEAALGTVVWGGSQERIGTGARGALDLLDGRFRPVLTEGITQVARALAEQKVGDACAFRRSMEQLLGLLGPDAPMLLLPAWPPSYPHPTGPPRCFHVTPFRPSWASETRDLARSVCKARGWEYSRADESAEQRVIPGIWRELSQASAVLVDITGRSPNVALELGLAHVLGRSTLVIAQGDPIEHLFPGIDKMQVQRYGSAPDYRGFATLLESLLSRTEVQLART
jgi:hypothetical protein